jgi:plastocyanin domain-containing protein
MHIEDKAKTTIENEVYIMMNVFKRFAEAYKENEVTVICGMAMMSGNTNVYPLYQALTDANDR